MIRRHARHRLGLPSIAALALATACGALTPPPLWERSAPAVEDRPLVPGERLHRAELPNGAKLLVLEDHRLPRVVLGVVTRRGVGSEAQSEAGVARFTTELMQRGAGDRDALELARAVDRLGADLGVGADWDATSATLAGLSRDTDALLGLLADVVLRPRFDAREAESVRSEQLAAIARRSDDPTALAGRWLGRVLYDGHRFGTPADGETQSVSRLDAGAARAFHARVFVPENAIVFAVGDVHTERFAADVRSAFAGWSGGATPPAPPPPPAPTPAARRIVIVDRPDLGQTQIALGQDGISRHDPTRHAAMLLTNVLGNGGFASRLMARLRSEAGLTYSISSGFAMRREGGPFVVATFTRVPETRRAIDLVLEELERIRREPPSESELANARSTLTGGFALGLETSAAIADALVSLDVQGLPADSLDLFRTRIRAVDHAAAAAVARDRIAPERMAIVVVGPAESLRPQLESLGPVEVVAP